MLGMHCYIALKIIEHLDREAQPAIVERIHRLDDPILDCRLIEIAERRRRVTDEMRRKFVVGKRDYLSPVINEILNFTLQFSDLGHHLAGARDPREYLARQLLEILLDPDQIEKILACAVVHRAKR